jgi:endothelin-converting enzyme/putative endopeptidase
MRTLACVLLCLFALPCDTYGQPPRAAPAALGIDERALDRSIDPCQDFYHFACGTWLRQTPIPPDRPAWSRSFSEIDERNHAELRQILEQLASAHGVDKTAYGDKLADYYAACMDETAIEQHAHQALAVLLKTIDSRVQDISSLATELARIHLGIANPLFEVGSEQDFADATRMIAVVDQGGLGLPDRDYYREPGFARIRDQYLAHVSTMLRLAGTPPTQAARQAQAVMAIETRLARASLSRVDRRDPKNVYHRIDLIGLETTAPGFPWKAYLSALGIGSVTQINVAVPGFFHALSLELKSTPLVDWKTYLRWHVIHGVAPALSRDFVDEDFAFYGRTLKGTAEILPRWKRCVGATDRALGEALAQPFVAARLGAHAKGTAEDLVKSIEGAMRADLTHSSWMDAQTREQALVKLRAVANQIGYPEKWRNYDRLEVSRASYLENSIHANEFETHRQLDKIGKPVDRNEWEMTPPTVNAYYTPTLNEMVFPAGILQPPFFARVAPPPVNYGAIGVVMGHELTHGFDDQGRQFDARGDLRDWWTPASAKGFEQRAACVVTQFDALTVLGDLHVNGRLTLGENIADLGGTKLAHAAFRAQQKGAPRIGGWTSDQLFFLGMAQSWCTNERDEYVRLRVTIDPHAPPQYRVNGPLSNLPEFAAAFSCQPGAKMVRAQPCAVW